MIKRQPLTYNAAFLEFARYYGFEIRLCNPAKGNENGRVERLIRSIRDTFENTSAHHQSMSAINQDLHDWIREKNNTVHRVTFAIPTDKVREEKLKTLPVNTYPNVAVHAGKSPTKTGLVIFDTNSYSIPSYCRNETVAVHAGIDRVDFFDGKGKRIASHPRSFKKRQIIINPLHRSVAGLSEGAKRERIYAVMCVKCAHCGCTITSDLKKGKYVYLFCTKYRGSCANHRIREEVVVEQVRDIFKSFQLPENVLEAIKNHLSSSANAKRVYHEEAISRIRRDYDLIQKKLDALLDMRLEGSITRDEYDKKCTQLKERQYELNAELSAHTKADESFNITVSTLLDLASRAYELFESSKVAQKRALINFTLSNLRLNGATLEYEKKKPFSLFGKTASCTEMLRLLDSNQRPGD